MGDRVQIGIKQNDENNSVIYLYSHWSGSSAFKQLKAGLTIGKGAWSDPEYLARIIYDQMLKGAPDPTMGYGISTIQHGDLSHPIPVLDCETRTIEWVATNGIKQPASCSFLEFIETY